MLVRVESFALKLLLDVLAAVPVDAHAFFLLAAAYRSEEHARVTANRAQKPKPNSDLSRSSASITLARAAAPTTP